MNITAGELPWFPSLSPLRRKVASNVAWLAGGSVGQMLISLLVLALVARELGPDQFGVLNYAISLAVVFAPVATLGMEGIVIREIVKRPHLTGEILGTAFALRLAGACAAVALLLGAVWLVSGNMQMAPCVLMIGLAFIPQSFDVIDLWFQKNIQSKYSMASRAMGLMLGLGVKLILLVAHAPLFYFCMSYLLDFVLVAAAFIGVYRHQEQEITRWRFSGNIALEILRDSWPLAVSGLLIIAYMRIEQLLVMIALGTHSAGIYSASSRISEIWILVPVIVLSSVYPVLVQKRESDPAAYHKMMQSIFAIMTAAGFVVAVAAFLLAPYLMPLLYGKDFNAASTILMIQAWTAPILFCGAVRGCYFLLENITIYHAWAAGIGLVVNVSLALPLMERFGAPGAAAAALASYIVSIYGTSFLFPRLRRCAGLQVRALMPPLQLSELKRVFCLAPCSARAAPSVAR